MKYRFEVEDKNYADFASGRVLYNRKGATAFPVRLASEIAQRCLAHVRRTRRDARLTLYDPCCGGAYLLTAIALLHGREFAHIYASDVDREMLELAWANLALLTPAGIGRRIAELQALIGLYGKESHREALASAERIREMVMGLTHLTVRCMQWDMLQPGLVSVVKPQSVDVVITDVPYGSLASWSQDVADPIAVMLRNLHPVLSVGAAVAVVAPNRVKTRAEGYRRLESFKIGKRSIVLLEPHAE